MAEMNDSNYEETKRLNQEIKDLQDQLREKKGSSDTFKHEKIDALVISDDNNLRVYTENTADKIYRILIEKMNEAAVTLDGDGAILYCNSYFASLVHIPLQKVIGTKFGKFSDDSSRENFESLIKLGWEHPMTVEVDIFSSDHQAIPVLMSLNKIPLNNNFILSIILTDLTIKNKIQQELKEKTRLLELKNIELENANKDLTSFTYVSSHDLQEPLRKIQMFVTCILRDEAINLSETGKVYFTKVTKAAKRMQALIEDLMTYSRTLNRDRNFEETDLNILVEGVQKDYEDAIVEKKAVIVAPNLCHINIIQFQFRQLFNNLISNSLKFSKPLIAPHITIHSEIITGMDLNIDSLSHEIDYCHLIYSDNGIGFDPQYNERIFEVFQRLHNQEQYAGTGMGLAICKRIIENHNGIITAIGKVDEGARFDIYIPLKREKAPGISVLA